MPASIGYVYERLVLSGLLEKLLTSPLKDSSLQRRVLKIFRSTSTLTEEDFPDDLKELWRKLEAASRHKIDPRNAWITKFEDETAACAMSLTRKEAREVLRAYADLVVKVAMRVGAIRKSAT